MDQYNQDRIEFVVASSWDLIIIDEVHRIAGQFGDAARHKLGAMLSKASPHLLLLTATPHTGKTEAVEEAHASDGKDAFLNTKAIVHVQGATFLIRTEKREAVDNEGNPSVQKASHSDHGNRMADPS